MAGELREQSHSSIACSATRRPLGCVVQGFVTGCNTLLRKGTNAICKPKRNNAYSARVRQLARQLYDIQEDDLFLAPVLHISGRLADRRDEFPSAWDESSHAVKFKRIRGQDSSENHNRSAMKPVVDSRPIAAAHGNFLATDHDDG